MSCCLWAGLSCVRLCDLNAEMALWNPPIVILVLLTGGDLQTPPFRESPTHPFFADITCHAPAWMCRPPVRARKPATSLRDFAYAGAMGNVGAMGGCGGCLGRTRRVGCINRTCS